MNNQHIIMYLICFCLILGVIKYNAIVLKPNPLKMNQQVTKFKSLFECAANCNKKFDTNSRYKFLHLCQ